MADQDISEIVPLDMVIEKRWFKLAPYMNDFVQKIKMSGINVDDYDVQITLVKKENN